MPKFFVTFKEFASDPVKAMLFICIIAIGYLYVDNKTVYKDQIEDCGKDVDELKAEVRTLREQLNKNNEIIKDIITRE